MGRGCRRSLCGPGGRGRDGRRGGRRGLFCQPAAGPAEGGVGPLALGMGFQRPRDVGQRGAGVIGEVSQPEEGRLIGRVLHQHGPEGRAGLSSPPGPGRRHPLLQALCDRHARERHEKRERRERRERHERRERRETGSGRVCPDFVGLGRWPFRLAVNGQVQANYEALKRPSPPGQPVFPKDYRRERALPAPGTSSARPFTAWATGPRQFWDTPFGKGARSVSSGVIVSQNCSGANSNFLPLPAGGAPKKLQDNCSQLSCSFAS